MDFLLRRCRRLIHVNQGKTLSLLCASLTWLGDEKNRAKKGILDALGTETDGMTTLYYRPSEIQEVSTFVSAGHDWVLAQTRERRARELEGKELEYVQRLAEARKKEEAMKRMASSRVHKKAVCNCHFRNITSECHLLSVLRKHPKRRRCQMRTQTTSFFPNRQWRKMIISLLRCAR